MEKSIKIVIERFLIHITIEKMQFISRNVMVYSPVGRGKETSIIWNVKIYHIANFQKFKRLI